MNKQMKVCASVADVFVDKNIIGKTLISCNFGYDPLNAIFDNIRVDLINGTQECEDLKEKEILLFIPVFCYKISENNRLEFNKINGFYKITGVVDNIFGQSNTSKDITVKNSLIKYINFTKNTNLDKFPNSHIVEVVNKLTKQKGVCII
jgi:hypothetical protein